MRAIKHVDGVLVFTSTTRNITKMTLTMIYTSKLKGEAVEEIGVQVSE